MRKRWPSFGDAMMEFTTISVMGVLTAVSCERKRCTTGNMLFGMR